MGKKVLIVRTDRMGDVLLTTPLSRLLHQTDPSCEVTWLVNRYTAPLLEHNPDVHQVLIDQGSSAFHLAKILRRYSFDYAIVALPRWRICVALWLAKIPIRIGPASKWYSILLTQRLSQHRSKSIKHEADYNLDLLVPLGMTSQRTPTRYVLTKEEKEWGRKTLEGHRIAFQKPIAILHPGSGGSSARWPLSHFMTLGDRLQKDGWDVVITAGPGEDYQSIMIDQMDRIPTFIAGGECYD